MFRYGPWKEKVLFNPWPGLVDKESWLCQTNCPSVMFTANDSVIMAFRGVQCQKPPARSTKEKIVIATAPHWSGPYTIRSKNPVFGWMVPDDWPPSLVTPGQVTSNEDPFIWRTNRGYHMLVHSQLQPFSRTHGAYGYSKDGLSWTLSPNYSWETNMTWTDGSVSYFVRRQAPGLYLDNEGCPLYLLTPVDELDSDGWLSLGSWLDSDAACWTMTVTISLYCWFDLHFCSDISNSVEAGISKLC